jgi:hypothetical protein
LGLYACLISRDTRGVDLRLEKLRMLLDQQRAVEYQLLIPLPRAIMEHFLEIFISVCRGCSCPLPDDAPAGIEPKCGPLWLLQCILFLPKISQQLQFHGGFMQFTSIWETPWNERSYCTLELRQRVVRDNTPRRLFSVALHIRLPNMQRIRLENGCGEEAPMAAM